MLYQITILYKEHKKFGIGMSAMQQFWQKDMPMPDAVMTAQDVFKNYGNDS